MKRTSVFTLLSCLGALAAGTAANMPFFAMDTGTRDGAHRTADAQVAMVKGLDARANLQRSLDAWRKMREPSQSAAPPRECHMNLSIRSPQNR